MKILLISPSKSDHKLKWFNRFFYHAGLSLSVVKNLTPEDIEVEIVDERIENIDINHDADLIGISVHTSVAPRSYTLANEFRKRKKTVVLGGYHPTARTQEALEYSDAVVVGPADTAWPQLLQDFKDNTLKKIYHGNKTPSLKSLIPEKRVGKKTFFPTNRLMTSIGCNYRCSTCAITKFYEKFMHKDLDSVIKEIKLMGKNLITFLDSNIVGNKKFAKELFRRIIPLNKKWIGQTTISTAYDDELLDLMAASGCIGLGIGFESINQNNIHLINKGTNVVSDYEKNINKIHKHGIIIKGNFMFGFDHDTPDVFEKTLEFAINNGIDLLTLNILTPYPGTRYYEQLANQGRLIHNESEHPFAWALYDRNHCVFKPIKANGLTPELLEYGLKWMYAQFYSLPNVKKKILHEPNYTRLLKIASTVFNGLQFIKTIPERKKHSILPSVYYKTLTSDILLNTGVNY
ncbi:B12-binding domain-containing radical SAM protein [Patescibacteria group bacterium]|nr:B12-binding domain-containing radical SAM protein [Patescibacteria group bacterium]